MGRPSRSASPARPTRPGAEAGACKTFTYDTTSADSNLVQTWTNLIPGDYTVSETAASGGISKWTVVVSGSPSTVNETGGQATAGVSNTRDLGYRKIIKIFDPQKSGFNGLFDIVYNCGAGDVVAGSRQQARRVKEDVRRWAENSPKRALPGALKVPTVLRTRR